MKRTGARRSPAGPRSRQASACSTRLTSRRTLCTASAAGPRLIFIRALREGVSPAGEHYYPAFPYTSYTRFTDTDLRVLWDYLRRQQPVAQASKPHELPWYLRVRPLMAVWKIFFFSPGQYAPRPDKDEAWNRGAYLAESAVHCGECHTPRNLLGAPRRDMAYAGTRTGPEDSVVPNITPDKKTGIGRWRKREIAGIWIPA